MLGLRPFERQFKVVSMLSGEKKRKTTLLWSTPLPRSFSIVAVETVPEFEHTTSDGDCLEHTDFAALIKQVTVTTMSDAGKTTTKLSVRKKEDYMRG